MAAAGAPCVGEASFPNKLHFPVNKLERAVQYHVVAGGPDLPYHLFSRHYI